MKYDKIEPKDNMNVTNKKEVDTELIRPKMERIVMTDPVKPKRGLFSRLIHGAFGPDGFRKIGSYIGQDIILPAIKNIVADSITSGINMALFGENHPPRSGLGRGSDYSRSYIPKTNYASRYNQSTPTSAPQPPQQTRGYNYVVEYVIEDRLKAAEILAIMKEAADKYGSVSVADYYDMIGVGTEFTDNNWGWSVDSILRTTIMPTRGGYVIKFPQLEVLV